MAVTAPTKLFVIDYRYYHTLSRREFHVTDYGSDILII